MKKLSLLFTLIAYSVTTFAESNMNDGMWPGAYLGLFLGSASTRATMQTYTGAFTPNSYFGSQDEINEVNQNASGTLSSGLPIGGLQFMNNWQAERFIYGLAFDYSAFSFSESHNVLNMPYPGIDTGSFTLQTSVSTHWLMTARGRIGFVPTLHPRSPLLYLTGGLAMTEIHVSNNFVDYAGLLDVSHFGFGVEGFQVGQGGASNNAIKTGWAYGGGIEMPLSKQWTLSSEYLFLNFGSLSANSTITSPLIAGVSSPYSTKASLNSQLIKISLNYKF